MYFNKFLIKRNFKNKILKIAAIIALAFFITGCSAKNDIESLDSAEKQSKQDKIESIQLTDGSDFSDGIAWVKYTDSTKSEKIGLLNTKGEISRITANEITKFGSAFSGGYAYVNYKDKTNTDEALNQFVIIDELGNITGHSPSDGNYEILLGGDGVFLVQQIIRNMTMNETRLGFIDKDGKWICEPAVHNVLSLSDVAQEGYRKGKIHFFYHGNRIFSAYYATDFDYTGNNYTCLYNADTGISVEYKGVKFPYRFEDEETIAVSDNAIYCVQTDLTLKLVLDNRVDGCVYFQNGIFFTGEEHRSGNLPMNYIVNGKFYNLDGSVLVDLSPYTLILDHRASDLYRFENGYAAMVIYGEDKDWYLGIINTKGEFTFEPIEIIRDDEYMGTFSCGVICVHIDENLEGKTFRRTILLTKNGEKIKTNMSFQTRLLFCNGFAWYNEDKQYIDIDGNVMNIIFKN